VYIVALHKVPDDEATCANLLGEITALSSYETSARLRVGKKFPIVITTYAEREVAQKTASKMSLAGFSPILLSHEEIESEENRIVGERLSFGEEALVVEGEGRKALVIGYDGVTLLLKGMRTKSTRKVWTEKSRKINPGKAILTGGIMMTSSSEKKHMERSDTRERFLHLYDKRKNILVLREKTLTYSSLGKTLQPTRAGNFAYIESEISRLCPGAYRNDVLLSRARQAQILGPLFDPEEDLDIAISLMVKSMLG